jgi:hypothetical protein
MTPGQAATATIFPSALTGGPRCASFLINAPPNFTGRWPYTVSEPGRVLIRGRLTAQQSRMVTVPLSPHDVSGNPLATVEITVKGQVPYPNGSVVSAAIANFAVGACPG